LSALALIATASGVVARDATHAQKNAANFKEADIKAYALVAVKLNSIQAQASLSEADKQSQVAAALKQSGMNPDRFNAITAASRTHPEVSRKIQQAIAEMTGPHMTHP
jgi:hypothetical protein